MSSERPTVLITGASVAGPALAWWLHRYGWAPTLLERAPRLREAGQNIDVRGAGRQVARRMGVEDTIRERGTGEQGTRFVDERGRVIAEFEAEPGEDGPTAELEILRGDLARILVDLTESDPGVEHVYGDHVVAVAQLDHELDHQPDDQPDDGAVEVTLAGGDTRRFDLLVVAEGLRSHTRDLVFGPSGDGVTIRDLGMYTAYGTIDRTADDDAWWRWFPAGGGRSVTLRPDNVGTTRATLSLMSEPDGLERLDVGHQVAVLRERFADLGWETGRVLAGFSARPDDFYFERTAQVVNPTWTRGRVVLVGDAAYAPSPVSGMGTTLSLTGAYVLAGELATHDNHADAFAAYERVMRPFVERAQQLPPGTPRLANPDSRAGLLALRTALRVASVIGPLLARLPLPSFGSPPADELVLPDYSGGPAPSSR